MFLCVFCLIAEIEELAGSVPDTGGVFCVPAFGGLLAPYWDDNARGVILGLSQFTTRYVI